MATPYSSSSFIQISPGVPPATPTPAPRGRGTGAKRGRKPRGALPNVSTDTSRPAAQQAQSIPNIHTQFTPVQWASPVPASAPNVPASTSTSTLAPSTSAGAGAAETLMESGDEGSTQPTTIAAAAPPSAAAPNTGNTPKPVAGDEDAEGEDELLPAMADDDYSAQLSWQSESKDNLKVLMDNFSPAQYDRFEAYRRHALPKQAVRRVIQQTTGQQVSQPVAQIVAGFAKVFVGEIVEKARAVQARRNETGPLSPDHLREAYRVYQAETGRVGSARAGRGRRLFVR
ncbi:TAFII28-domain-containing protein [Phlebopus sp. FC_14]|nr:TAFII28-domain-containing protein [Phlebopus sp. FC_14]